MRSYLCETVSLCSKSTQMFSHICTHVFCTQSSPLIYSQHRNSQSTTREDAKTQAKNRHVWILFCEFYQSKTFHMQSDWGCWRCCLIETSLFRTYRMRRTPVNILLHVVVLDSIQMIFGHFCCTSYLPIWYLDAVQL